MSNPKNPIDELNYETPSGWKYNIGKFFNNQKEAAGKMKDYLKTTSEKNMNMLNQEEFKIYGITMLLSIIVFILIGIMLIYKTTKKPVIISIIFAIVFTILYRVNYNFFNKILGSPAKDALFYNIGLIFLFAILPYDYKEKYAYIILPIIVFYGIVIFYKAFTFHKNEQGINFIDLINLERINYSLIILALTIFILILYITNPGGYITRFSWFGIIIIISLYIIGFLYLNTIMRTRDSNSNSNPNDKNNSSKSGMNMFSWITLILFIISFCLLAPDIFTDSFLNKKDEYVPYTLNNNEYIPDTINNSYNKKFINPKSLPNASIICFSIILFTLLLIAFVKSLFLYSKTDESFVKNIQSTLEKFSKISQNIFLILLGITATSTLLYWIIMFYQKVVISTSIGNIIIYSIALIAISFLVYKLVVQTAAYKDSPLFQLIFNAVFYIPCLLVSLFDAIPYDIRKNFKPSTETIPNSYYVILLISILLLVCYFSMPFILRTFTQQGGQLLINQPITINKATTLASYEQLNKSIDNHSYQYGLSFWFYIDSYSPSTNKSYEGYANILDYGNKPRIIYNASTNTLRVTMKVGEGSKSTDKILQRKLDANGNLIIYELKNVKLQKWNNMIINYSGGALDIFYDGELVKSSIGIIPYYNNTEPQTETTTSIDDSNYNNLIVGQDNGLYGQICNVNYFNKALNIFQIHYLYNSVKDYTPPALISTDKVIKIDANIGTGNILGESTIMADLPPEEENKYPSEPTDAHNADMAKDTIKDKTDYLSLKWYFTANKDIYNSA